MSRCTFRKGGDPIGETWKTYRQERQTIPALRHPRYSCLSALYYVFPSYSPQLASSALPRTAFGCIVQHARTWCFRGEKVRRLAYYRSSTNTQPPLLMLLVPVIVRISCRRRKRKPFHLLYFRSSGPAGWTLVGRIRAIAALHLLPRSSLGPPLLIGRACLVTLIPLPLSLLSRRRLFLTVCPQRNL